MYFIFGTFLHPVVYLFSFLYTILVKKAFEDNCFFREENLKKMTFESLLFDHERHYPNEK